MKNLELNQMENLQGGDCSDGEGAVAAAAGIGWVLGPIGWGLAMAAALTYWTHVCGPNDY